MTAPRDGAAAVTRRAGGLRVEGLSVEFSSGSGLGALLAGRPRSVTRAVADVSLQVEPGTSVGVVGESGCGKSSLARAIIGLTAPAAGRVVLDGQVLGHRRDPAARRRIQMIFQDPGASLNPRMTVGRSLTEIVRYHRLREGPAVEERCRELVDLVAMPAAVLDARPQHLSGGQKQRVAIARALAVEPDILIADEAVSALDVSVQAAILNLLRDLQARLGLTLLFISHDLGVVRHIADRVVVMYLGRLVEDRPAHALFTDPRHPYTRALLAAAPRLGIHKVPGSAALAGEVTSAPEGACPFSPRCPERHDACVNRPQLTFARPAEAVACHLGWVDDRLRPWELPLLPPTDRPGFSSGPTSTTPPTYQTAHSPTPPPEETRQ